jgi:hypothetical protein
MQYTLGNMLGNGRALTRAGLLNGLVAYWKLEEASGTRYDSHGSYDLTENVGIDNGTGVKGNCAISNSTYYDLRSLLITPAPYDSVGSSWSLSFWMSTNGEQDTNQMFPNAWTNCCLFAITTLDGVLTVGGTVWHDPIGQNQPTSTVVSKSGVYGGGFVHVAVTHNLATKTVRVYYDGVEEHMFVYNDVLCGVSPLNGFENDILSMFAGDISGTGYAGPGKMDEVGIWGRELTAGEVSALYNGGSGITYEDF